MEEKADFFRMDSYEADQSVWSTEVSLSLMSQVPGGVLYSMYFTTV